MRIAYFTESLPPSTDGVANTMTQLCRSLVTRGVEALFFSPFEPGRGTLWDNRVIRVASFPLWLYPDYRIGLPAMSDIFNRLDRFRPDLVHAASPTPLGYTALNYAAKRNLPAVASYHTDFVGYLRYYGFRGWKTWGGPTSGTSTTASGGYTRLLPAPSATCAGGVSATWNSGGAGSAGKGIPRNSAVLECAAGPERTGNQRCSMWGEW